jgi:cell shape-determining protein MreC
MSDWPALEDELLRSAARLYPPKLRARLFRRPRFSWLIMAAATSVSLIFFGTGLAASPTDDRPAASPVTSGPFARYGPIAARVIVRDASASRLGIDRGSEDGVRRGDPVVAGGALIGRVERVTPTAAAVMLITDPLFSVAARAGRARVYGLIEPSAGRLQLALARHPEAVQRQDRVYTAGTPASRPDLRSAYPAGILIGTVTRVDPGTGALDRAIGVATAARLDKLTDVQVLTRPQGR